MGQRLDFLILYHQKVEKINISLTYKRTHYSFTHKRACLLRKNIIMKTCDFSHTKNPLGKFGN